MTSNVAQSYPYSSETEPERAAAIDRLLRERADLGPKLSAETTPLDANERWWTWKCPTSGCPGLLHAAGYALDLHALYVVLRRDLRQDVPALIERGGASRRASVARDDHVAP